MPGSPPRTHETNRGRLSTARSIAATGGDSLIWAAGLCLAVANGALLVRGYRIAPDDAMFYAFALRGWDAVMAETAKTAYEQGRMGSFIIIPLNVAAAYLSDHLAFRWLCVALNYAVFALFALWAERVLATRCAAVLFLILAALNVTDYFHFSPVSFPLQNTVPFLAVLGARLLAFRAATMPPAFRRCAAVLVGWALLLFGMIATEYGFLLATAMLACEIVVRALRQRAETGLLRPAVVARFFAPEIAACALALALYVAWRVGHPSTYGGNQFAGPERLPQGLLTAAAHVFVPVALPYANLLRPLPFPAPVWMVVAASAGLVGAVAAHAAQGRLTVIPRPLAVAGMSMACAFYVVLPVAMTLKQQERCLQRFGCAFLDSQMAYLFMGVAIAAMAGWLLTRFRPTPRGGIALTLSVAFGFAAALTFFNNLRMTNDMRRIADVWDRAQTAVCAQELPLPLATYFDPGGAAAMHEQVDREAFWTLYRDHHRPLCIQ
ncbi:MAG: hypothetical protein JNL61_13690 [Rhizobiaceae bacterium]|nr:hypothetical protein [Rhizobiaceae bacterium]